METLKESLRKRDEDVKDLGPGQMQKLYRKSKISA